MGLPHVARGTVPPVIVLILIAWVVQLAGLYYLQKSCNDRSQASPWWAAAAGAGLPATNTCFKVYRYHWWAVWFEFPLVVGIVSCLAGWLGSGNNILSRYRMAWIGLLATCTAMQMWSANVMLNLTDTLVQKAESPEEITRARVAFYGFAGLSALNAIMMFILGDDGPSASTHHEPLLGSEA